MLKSICIFLAICSEAAAQVRVIDGDTLDLNGQRIRIEGIDAPEAAQTCTGKAGLWRCGQAATDKLIALTDGRQVTCTGSQDDGRGRIIARCQAGGTDLGAAMTQSGHAWAFRKYSDSYIAVETDAKARGLGIWAGDNEPPWVFREKRWASEAQDAPEGCPIKGNISSNGRIYHLPWMRDYARTRINTSKGERWFCDEAEAIAAGWRAPLNH